MQPICRLYSVSHAILVNRDSLWQTPQEFINDAKARTGEMAMGVSGIGKMSHLNAENFKLASGADVKIVSFEGGTTSLAALVGKHINSGSYQVGEVVSFVDAGELRMLAVGDDNCHPDILIYLFLKKVV